MQRTATKSLTPDQNYLMLGMALLMLYSAQLMLNLRWDWLANLQSNEFYRQFTGYLLLAYVLMQARLGIKRMKQKPSPQLVNELSIHKVQGIFGPFVFYIHSIEVGYAYQMLLAFVFLGNCIIGYCSPYALRLRSKLYLVSWTILHISLAILTLALMLFHIVVVYRFS